MQLSKTITLILGILILSAPALAQSEPSTYGHVYGGGSVVPKDGSRGYVFGAGTELGLAYIGFDGYGLRPTDELVEDLQGLANEAGIDYSIRASGWSIVLGGAIAQSEKFAVVPVGIIGRTTGEVCIETFCDDGFKEANYGGGLIARMMGSKKVGLHAGIRYTRHYGTAFTVGLTWASD